MPPAPRLVAGPSHPQALVHRSSRHRQTEHLRRRLDLWDRRKALVEPSSYLGKDFVDERPQSTHEKDRLGVKRHGYGTDSSNYRHGERIQHLGARHLVIRLQPQIFDALQVESPPSSKAKKAARAQQPVEDLVANPREEHTNIAESRRTSPDELVIVVAASQPIGALLYVLDGILIGAGDTRYLAWTMLVALVAFLPLAGAVLVTEAGIIALWWVLAGWLRRYAFRID